MTAVKRFLMQVSTWSFVPVTLIWLAAMLALMTAMVAIGLLTYAHAGIWLMPLLVLTIFANVFFMSWGKWMRERFVREAPLPMAPKRKLREAFSALSGKDADLAERALRQFFAARVRSSSNQDVAMPSRLVEQLWREFASDIDIYARWCKTAFGRVVAPTAAQRLGLNTATNDALRRTWFWACKEEAINPKNPSRLPLLFALDAKLMVSGGIVYASNSAAVARMNTPDRSGNTGEVYFGTGFSSNHYSGDHENFGGADSSSDSSGGSDSGGGDGGGGGGD